MGFKAGELGATLRPYPLKIDGNRSEGTGARSAFGSSMMVLREPLKPVNLKSSWPILMVGITRTRLDLRKAKGAHTNRGMVSKKAGRAPCSPVSG